MPSIFIENVSQSYCKKKPLFDKWRYYPTIYEKNGFFVRASPFRNSSVFSMR